MNHRDATELYNQKSPKSRAISFADSCSRGSISTAARKKAERELMKTTNLQLRGAHFVPILSLGDNSLHLGRRLVLRIRGRFKNDSLIRVRRAGSAVAPEEDG